MRDRGLVTLDAELWLLLSGRSTMSVQMLLAVTSLVVELEAEWESILSRKKNG
jgi:hypothetical protein